MVEATTTSIYTANMGKKSADPALQRYKTKGTKSLLTILYTISIMLLVPLAAHSIYILVVADKECYALAILNIMFVFFQILFEAFYIICLNFRRDLLLAYRGMDKISSCTMATLLAIYNGVEAVTSLAHTTNTLPYEELQYVICSTYACLALIKVVDFFVVSNYVFKVESNMLLDEELGLLKESEDNA